MNDLRQAPLWVTEEIFIQNLLLHFIDKIKRGVKVQIRVNPKNTPQLYDHQNDDPGYLWSLVKVLDKEYHLLSIKKQRAQGHQESYENAQINFNLDKEPLLRHWLNQPAIDAYALIWQQGLDKIRNGFEDRGYALQNPVRAEGIPGDAILKGFKKLAQELHQPQTLRNLSSKCFWGDSKFLDSRQDLVYNTFPYASKTIQPRELLINVYLPDTFNSIVFVENQDSFLLLAEACKTNDTLVHTALIYSAGFKATAKGSRMRGHAKFSYINTVTSATANTFSSWWRRESQKKLICYFWGDLDFSGMSILGSLKKNFETLTAWQPAYQLMLSYLDTGLGHSAKDAHKDRQRPPEKTHCQYSDEILLPCLLDSQRFLDQEVLALHELEQL
ncbi:MAG: hypothetical protein ACI93R_001801 [Flavobacteriales bacterium]|jgi:hypothetical protein